MNELATRIAAMPTDELLQLGKQYDSLTDEAQTLVRAEFQRRSIEPPLAEEAADTWALQGVATIRQYRDLPEALMARSALESAGIACFLRDENTIRMEWIWSNLMGGIRLQVASSDLEAAEAVLTQPIPASIAVEGEPDYRQPVCPRCGSLDIVVDDLDKKVKATSMLVLGLPLPSFTGSDSFRCNACGCHWTDDDAEAP